MAQAIGCILSNKSIQKAKLLRVLAIQSICGREGLSSLNRSKESKLCPFDLSFSNYIRFINQLTTFRIIISITNCDLIFFSLNSEHFQC